MAPAATILAGVSPRILLVVGMAPPTVRLISLMGSPVKGSPRRVYRPRHRLQMLEVSAPPVSAEVV